MKSCLAIINRESYGGARVSRDAIESYMRGYKVFFAEDEPFSAPHDALFVCGGDGTLNVALNRGYAQKSDIFYYPCGTLNDKAHCYARENDGTLITGVADNKKFSYVLACGSFTAIGYATDSKRKKRWKRLAYYLEALKQYKIYKIPAVIDAEGDKYEGEYTLIMFVKSRYCFGFPFNRAFDRDAEEGHVLLIKSPRHKGIIGKIEMFFPFFRAFFIGFKGEKHTDKIDFFAAKSLTLTMPATAFCMDGEKQIFKQNPINIAFRRYEGGFRVCRLRGKGRYVSRKTPEVKSALNR